MKFLVNSKISVLLIVFCAALLTGGGTAKADFTFGTPTNLGPTVNTSSGEGTDCFSADGLEMYLSSNRPGGLGVWDIWLSTRETLSDEWSAPVNLGGPVNSAQHDAMACTSTDGLSLYFSSTRPGGLGGHDLYITTRATLSDPWGQPVNLGPTVNTSSQDSSPWLSADGMELYFHSNRAGGFGSFDIWVTMRATINDSWGPPINLGAVVNSPAFDLDPLISADGLLLFFDSERPGGYGKSDMWMARRASISDPWDPPVNLGPVVNNSSDEGEPRISPDGSMLHFYSTRPGGLGGDGDIWQAPIIPIIDFNADGKVNRLDVGLLMLHWGTDNSLYDIGPTPFGDGIVDSKDLMVLAVYGAVLAGDVNYDGVVDFLDLAELAKNWLRQQR